MAIHYNAAQGQGLIADRKLLLSADKTRVLEADDPDGAFLLASPGTLIPGEDVARLGLEGGTDGKITQKHAPPALPAEAANEMGAIEAAVKDRLKADWEMRVQAVVEKEVEDLRGDLESIEPRKVDAKKAAKVKTPDEVTAEADRKAEVVATAKNRAALISRQALIDRGDPVKGGPNAPKVEDEAEKTEKARKEAAKDASRVKIDK